MIIIFIQWFHDEKDHFIMIKIVRSMQFEINKFITLRGAFIVCFSGNNGAKCQV